MREIKFRAWDGKQFWYWGIGDINGDGSTCSFPSGTIAQQPQMQYTGLKDKNGVGIYEGDIISLANNGEIYGVVIFDDGVEFGLPCFCIKSSEGHCENFFDSGDEPRVWFEIIGNIYQNAELLE